MMFPKKLNHGRIKKKWNPKPNAAEKRYHLWVISHGCIVNGREAVPHHIIDIDIDGKRVSKDHWLVVPLSSEPHTDYHDHLGNNENFLKKYKIDLYKEAKRLIDEYYLSL